MNHKIVILFFVFFTLRYAEAQRYTFQKIGLEQGVPSARINDFFEDSRGFFWIATEGAGLVRYDGFEFKSIDIQNENIRPIVTALAEDDDGNIWFASESALIRYDGLNSKFYFLPNRQERITRIISRKDGSVLVASSHGIHATSAGDTLTAVKTGVEGAINDIEWDEDQLWIASDSGLYRADEKIRNGKWTSIFSDDNGIYAQSEKLFWSSNGKEKFDQLGGDHFCIKGRTGLALRGDSLILLEDGREKRLGHDNGLPDDDFKGCYIDRAGVVWLYSNSGLSKLPTTALELYDQVGGEVFSVLKNGEEFLAGTGSGLHVIRNSKIISFTGDKFPYGVVLSMAYYDNYYWLGTERGLIRYDGHSFRQVSLGPNQDGYVFALKANAEGLWIGTGMGILRYRNGGVVHISEKENLPIASIYAISEGVDGSLWFGTYISGFLRKSGNDWDNVLELGGMRLDSLRFNSFTAVSKNELWVGSLSEGIFHLTENNIRHIAASDINFAEPRSMILDSSHNLWMGSNKGLYTIYKSEGGYRPRLINQTQQLLTDGFTPDAISVTEEVLLAGTSNGLMWIDLEEMEKARTPPAIALTGIEFFFGEMEIPVDYAEGITAFTGIPYGFELPYDLNFISFTIAGLSGYQPQDLIYRYRIDREQKWTQAGNRREAVYSNLPPGHYEFQAQVTRPGEQWGKAMISYPFRIKPPLWQQWWFIFFLVLVLGTITYWYVRDRINRANQRLVLEKSLLEMERKALRLQMNPHFIFNALDSISSFIFRKDPKQAVKYLNNFAKLMRLTLESSMEHLHPVETEVSVLKNYLELEKLRFQGKLEYRIEVDEEIDYDVGIPPMLVQPHVENAILHGIKPKEAPGMVTIRFLLQDDLLICEIEDDGIGRKRSRELEKRKDHRSMATEINKGRLALLRKSMGGKVDIEIIDKENHSGTKVVLKLPAESI